jgi:hypothetical protein
LSAVSRAEQDEQFLTALTDAGLRITDARIATEGGRGFCGYLAAGHTQTDAVALALHNNSLLTAEDARVVVSAAVRIYCPWEGR